MDPSAEGLGARLLLECGAGDDEEEEEEDEEEAAGEEVRAADRVGAGETSRSPDSISVKHNPISRVTIGKNTHPYTDKHTLKCVHTTAYCAPLQHTHSSTPMHKQPHTHTYLLTLFLSHLTSPEQYFHLAMLTGSQPLLIQYGVGRRMTCLRTLIRDNKAGFTF